MRSHRSGASTRDVVLGLAVLSLLAALAHPWIARSRFGSSVDALEADVIAVREGALRYASDRGAWPPESAPGVVPPELATDLPQGFEFQREAWTLDWNRWEAVEVVETTLPAEDVPLADDEIETDTVSPPPSTFMTMASVSVHTGDERLLSELLGRFGGEASFVRDSVWTLVLPRSLVGR